MSDDPPAVANTLRCASCGYEKSSSELSTRDYCPRCGTERAFVLKEGTQATLEDRQFDVMSVYTREMALQDGVFVDVTGTARGLGYRSLVTLSMGVWDRYVDARPDEETALRGLLHRLHGPAQEILRKGGSVDVTHRGTRVRVALAADEAGHPDVRVFLPEEE